jgi:hypothetical protein
MDDAFMRQLHRWPTCSGCCTQNRSMSQCAKCHRVHYCSKRCQIGHWKEHKQVCGKTRHPDPVAWRDKHGVVAADGSKIALDKALMLVKEGERILVLESDPYRAPGSIYLQRDNITISGQHCDRQTCFVQFFISARGSFLTDMRLLHQQSLLSSVSTMICVCFSLQATGGLRQCEVDGMITADGAAAPTISHCYIHSSGGSGVSCEGQSRVTVHHCRIRDCTIGLAAVETAKPVFYSNLVQHSKDSGIDVQDSSVSIVRSNAVSQNHQHGIVVWGKVAASLRGTRCGEMETLKNSTLSIRTGRFSWEFMHSMRPQLSYVVTLFMITA